ncbi:hypothetical protein BJ944DRAFT_252193 [Cunninghamella echinulata]|nr:hypothetical protein BJ944DRAFT_252193 [Cunninghamella echinulata]
MQPSLITLNDAITDSPVYRSNVLHFDDQLDLLDKWLDALSKHLKLYCEKLNKFNLETNILCKKVMPVGIDEVLIDPHFTGAVIRSFSDALQTSLAFKTKLVSDIEDDFIQPLQQFVKVQLKDFKDFRKQHEKALERYEAQLSKYSSQSKSKEVSALREEAFRLHEARKYYVHMSGQHVVRMLQFRSALEHTLVEHFSAATLAHLNDIDGSMQVWQKLDVQLESWKQWLVDDKSTCNYQLHKLQATRKELENEFLNQSQPPRDLEKYIAPAFTTVPQSPMANRFSLDISETATPDQLNKPYHKWGYLFTKNARGYWTRRWFFLYNGYFGSCLVNASHKLKGAISLDERVSVLLSEIKPVSDIDRRYCFEVVCVQQAPIIVQAETEDEMKEWISAFDKAKRLAIQNEHVPNHTTNNGEHQKTIEPKNEPSTVYNNINTSVTNSSPFLSTANSSQISYSHVDASKSFVTLTGNNNHVATSNNQPLTSSPTQENQPSIVLLSTSADNDRVSLANSTSLTPLLVWEAARASSNQLSSPSSSQMTSTPTITIQNSDNGSVEKISTTNQDNDNNNNNNNNNSGEKEKNDNNQLSRRPLNLTIATKSSTAASSTTTHTSSTSWGIPWTLVPSMFQSSGSSNEPPPTPSTTSTPLLGELDGHQVIWPSHHDECQVQKVELNDYTSELELRNKELRQLFGGVAPHEIVLDAFICSLKKIPNKNSNDTSILKDDDNIDWPTSPIGNGGPLEQIEQELQTQLNQSVKPPTSQFGYSYTGRAFITQEAFWFYSCVVMSCVNTVAVRLTDIKNIRLIRDPSITNTGKQSNIALAIDLREETQGGVTSPREPLILMTLMDDVEVIAEKLRITVENAKQTEAMPCQLQTMYDILHHMSAAMSKKKNAPVTTIIKTEPAKAHSSPDLLSNHHQQQQNNGDIHHLEPAASPIPSSSTSSKLERIRKNRKGTKNKDQDNNNHNNNNNIYNNKLQPKSGALAAAMMAATVAGGSNIFDVSKVSQRSDGENENIKHTSKNKRQPSLPTVSTDATNNSDHRGIKAGDDDASTKHEQKSTAPSLDELPPHIQAPNGPAGCGCDDHLEKMEYEANLQMSAKRLFELLFSEEKTGAAANGGIWNQKTIASGSRDLNVGQWNNVDGKQQRILKYVMPVNNPMVKVKEADVVETQVMLKVEDHIRYVVQISTKSAQLPYADAFIPSIRYCISWVSKSQCRLSICMGVKFVKNILVKGMVMKAALKGMGESIAQFAPMIIEQVNKNRPQIKGAPDLVEAAQPTDTTASTTTATMPSTTTSSKTEKKGDDGFLGQVMVVWDTLQDVLSNIPLPIGTILAGLLIVWIFWGWLRAGTHHPDTYPHSYYAPNHNVISKAIYLRDVEEGLLNTNLQLSHMDTQCYKIFLESKEATRNSNSSNTLDQWHNPKHYMFSVELLFSRERLAMLRHDTLVIFQLLNQVDAQLLENEYVNWLLDTRLQCHAGVTIDNAVKCEAVYHQLKTISSSSS